MYEIEVEKLSGCFAGAKFYVVDIILINRTKNAEKNGFVSADWAIQHGGKR